MKVSLTDVRKCSKCKFTKYISNFNAGKSKCRSCSNEKKTIVAISEIPKGFTLKNYKHPLERETYSITGVLEEIDGKLYTILPSQV